MERLKLYVIFGKEIKTGKEVLSGIYLNEENANKERVHIARMADSMVGPGLHEFRVDPITTSD